MTTAMEFDCEPENQFSLPDTDCAPSLIRTRSYDEDRQERAATLADDFHLSPFNPLHTSFDASQLIGGLPPPSVLPCFRPAASWEENDPSVASVEGTAKQTHFHVDLIETIPPHVPPNASKNPRHSSDNAALASKTPLRPRLRSRKSGSKQTPASAKRHRAPLHTRKSPRLLQMTPQRTQQLFPPGTMLATTPKDPDRFTLARPMPKLLLDDDANETPYSLSARRKKKSIGTVTTAASSAALETTSETEDSMDTNDAPFRFTSFPASLPRVQNLRATIPSAPGTVRKRMHFADSMSEVANRSVDDATHNTSVSSLHVDDGNLYDLSDEEAAKDAPGSPVGTPVTRTRLDFGAAGSPATRRRTQTPVRSHAANAPTTPREVKMHFLNASNCSPIRDIPEEDCEGSSGKSIGGFSRRNLSQDRSRDSSSSSKPVRPMPDMGAFEENASTPTRERSGSDTASTKSHSSPRLLCPPTPVRTPAWANGDSSGSRSMQRNGKAMRFNRQNSLIATKVLATCLPHALHERNSLENSGPEDGVDNHAGNSKNNSSSLSDSSGLDTEQGLSFEVDTVVVNPDGMDDTGEWSTDAEREGRPSLGTSSQQSVTLSTSFDTLSLLGSGTFADVYKVRSKVDGRLYAVKKNRRQFRGKRDREKALAEVRFMQQLQSSVSIADGNSSYSLYLLFFFQAWQEEGFFFCQTELCCRDTCREMLDALRSDWRICQLRYPSFSRLSPLGGVILGTEADLCGRLTPEATIWKICHDISAGLSHIHSHGLVHNDIKPSNIFFVPHIRFGAICKIGDFGMAAAIGSIEDGQEGDQKYMAPELLNNEVSHPSADIFSLGLTLYELASNLDFEIPSHGLRWHELRKGSNHIGLPSFRSTELVELIRVMIRPKREERPTADTVVALPGPKLAGRRCDEFLRDYIQDIEDYDLREQQKNNGGLHQDQTPVIPGRTRVWASPTFGTLPPVAPFFDSPDAA